jgi:hypothetical protein
MMIQVEENRALQNLADKWDQFRYRYSHENRLPQISDRVLTQQLTENFGIPVERLEHQKQIMMSARQFQRENVAASTGTCPRGFEQSITPLSVGTLACGVRDLLTVMNEGSYRNQSRAGEIFRNYAVQLDRMANFAQNRAHDLETAIHRLEGEAYRNQPALTYRQDTGVRIWEIESDMRSYHDLTHSAVRSRPET